MQEEVPDARRLDPGDVGGSAGEHAGFVLHSAADGAEAHHAVHLPAVLTQLAQQRTAGVPLKERGAVKRQPPRECADCKVSSRSYLTGCRGVLGVSEPGTDHGVPHAVAPELLLPAGFEIDDGQTGLIQSFCQRDVLLPT